MTVETVKQSSTVSLCETLDQLLTPGETQAYTIGDIGGHRCVVTKLPMTGHSREASIASGSSTTRLLGRTLSVTQLS